MTVEQVIKELSKHTPTDDVNIKVSLCTLNEDGETVEVTAAECEVNEVTSGGWPVVLLGNLHMDVSMGDAKNGAIRLDFRIISY